MTALTVEGLTAGYKKAPVVHGVSFAIERGECVAVIGPNGAGKSTCLKAIAGLVPRAAGEIRSRGRALSGDARRVAAEGVAFIPQDRNVFGALSVAENLDVSAWGRKAGPARERVLALLPDLRPLLGRLAAKLSGGQRQLLALGMALMTEPEVVLADEPCAGLSPVAQAGVLKLLRTIAASGPAVLIVEQNVSAVLAHTDRALILVEGRVHWVGPSDRLAAHPDLGALFFGRAAA